jgi:hypothetical protein
MRLASYYAGQRTSLPVCWTPIIIGVIQIVLYFSGVLQDSFYLGASLAFIAIGYFLFVIRGFQSIDTQQRSSETGAPAERSRDEAL